MGRDMEGDFEEITAATYRRHRRIAHGNAQITTVAAPILLSGVIYGGANRVDIMFLLHKLLDGWMKRTEMDIVLNMLQIRAGSSPPLLNRSPPPPPPLNQSQSQSKETNATVVATRMNTTDETSLSAIVTTPQMKKVSIQTMLTFVMFAAHGLVCASQSPSRSRSHRLIRRSLVS
eukprot:SAG11_NODE_401_length_9759_cov_119.937992_12_plen_175_part_00